jgi:hypothetical protein
MGQDGAAGNPGRGFQAYGVSECVSSSYRELNDDDDRQSLRHPRRRGEFHLYSFPPNGMDMWRSNDGTTSPGLHKR